MATMTNLATWTTSELEAALLTCRNSEHPLWVEEIELAQEIELELARRRVSNETD